MPFLLQYSYYFSVLGTAACFVPVLSMKRTYPMDTIRKMHGLTMKIAVFMDRYAKQPTFYVEPFYVEPKSTFKLYRTLKDQIGL